MPSDWFWKGPQVEPVTYSLLCKFLVDQERFRLLVEDGLKEVPEWNHHIEYGSMFHVCLEASAKNESWQQWLVNYRDHLRATYPAAEKEIIHWYSICRVQFPLYLKYRKEQPGLKYLYREKVFQVEYKLPSGTPILLSGCFDGVRNRGLDVFLQEDKTKGANQIDAKAFAQTVTKNLQVMFYVIALQEHLKTLKKKYRLKGVIYNITMRPLSDRHAIRRKKSERPADFYRRIGEEYISSRPEAFFHTWSVGIYQKDIDRFKERTLTPLLTLLDYWYHDRPTMGHGIRKLFHFEMPFGVYNPLSQGFGGPYFDYLTTGSKSGLIKAGTLHPELEERDG